MITKLTKHDTHSVKIHLTKPNSKHYAALRCVECNVHIQWLSNKDTEIIAANGVDYYNKG
jgi:hypothetical protein